MKQMVCEMCGSTDLIKQEGVFVCQTCGTKYSVEEAKKMIIEGKVDVSGSTVKVDQSDELKNLYILARRAKNDKNINDVRKYYEQILVKDPNSWEANFYAAYSQQFDSIEDISLKLATCVNTVFQLIKDHIKDADEQKAAITEVASTLIFASSNYFETARKQCTSLQDKTPFIRYADTYYATSNIVFKCGDYVVQHFGNQYVLNIAVPCWKEGVRQFHTILGNKTAKEYLLSSNGRTIFGALSLAPEYLNKIRAFEPTYLVEEKKSDGCYVATAVYGSYDCPEVWTLRRYRDDTLAKTWYGRMFIHTYYAISPTIVKCFGDTEWFKNMWRGKLDHMVEKLKSNGVDDTPYEDRNWR